MSSLREAFEEFGELDDILYDIDNKEDIEKLKKSLDSDDDDLDNLEMIVDIDAEDEEDLQDSYVGELLLLCPSCHTIHYAKKEDIVEDEENPEYVNVGEQCPHCDAEEGFEIVGEVAPYNDNETEETETEDDVEIEDEFDLTDEDDLEDEENFKESLKSGKQKSFLERLLDNDFTGSNIDENGRPLELEGDDDTIEEKVGSVLPRVKKQVKENKTTKTTKKSLKESYVVVPEKDEIGVNIDVDTIDGFADHYNLNAVVKDGNVRLSGDKKNIQKALEDMFGEDGAQKYSITESKLVEKPVYGLNPRYDSRKSFYGKAQVDTGDKGDQNKLYSYDTLVAEIKDGKPVVYGTYSNTTLRHIKDWLLQNGFKADSKAQIEKDYMTEGCKTNECALKENASDEYAEIIDRAKMEIDDGASDVDEAIWGAIDSYVYLDDYEILKELFRIEDLYLENGENVSTYIMEHIFDEVYSEVKDYFIEKHENDEDDDEIEESLTTTKRTVEQIKESIKTKLDKTIREGLEKEKDDIDAKADDKKEVAKEKEEKAIDDADADKDYDEDELDENLFDNLINKYCTRVYENVKDYKTTNGYTQDHKLVLEGLLTYKSGKTTNTKFIFEKKMTKDNKVKYVGLNETFSKSKRAFSLNCNIKDNKILSESLTYNYKVKVNDDRKVVYGSIKNN